MASGSSSTRPINFAGFAYAYGVRFSSGEGGSSSASHLNFTSLSPWWWKFEQCVLDVASTGGSAVNVGTLSASLDDMLLELVETDIEFTAVGQTMNIAADLRIRGGQILGTVPTTLLTPFRMSSTTKVTCLDLSAIGSGKNIVDISGVERFDCLFKNCKLGASVALTTGSPAGQGGGMVAKKKKAGFRGGGRVKAKR